MQICLLHGPGMFEIPILFKLIWLLDSNHYHLELWANPKQKTQLSHDSFLKFLLGLFEVVEVKGYLRLNFEMSPQRGEGGGYCQKEEGHSF